MRISTPTARLLIPLVALSFAAAMSPAVADSSNNDGQNGGVIYNSVLTPLPGNLPSQPFEAQQVSEFGNAVNFSGGSNHTISKVVVTMSSWGCASGSWSLNTCSTPEDASFSVPITLNVYGPSTDGINPGAKIISITKTFDINYRPSASPMCTGSDAGKWYDKSSKTCFNGLAQNITFNVKNVRVGTSAIFGIAYNTTHYGYAPIGQSAPCFSTPQGCGYDSLNVALTQDPTDVTVGSSVVPGKDWLNTAYPAFYADNGAAGLNTFRIDSPNVAAWWGVNAPYNTAPWYVPAIKVFASNAGKGDNESDSKSPSAHSSDNSNSGKQGIKKD